MSRGDSAVGDYAVGGVGNVDASEDKLSVGVVLRVIGVDGEAIKELGRAKESRRIS
jgi:hypothetical protein